MAPSAQPAPQPFVRDRFTWLAYLMLAYFAYLQSGLGPAMPFLRTELGVSYTVGGLLISVFACGMILAGLVGDGLAGHWGRRRVFWGGGAGMAVGTLCLMTSRQVAFTLLGAFIMGACGALLLVMIQATLADRHGPRRTVALTESNIAASICASLAPVLIGTFERTGLGWRAALSAALLGWLALGLWFRKASIPDAHPVAGTTGSRVARLPPGYWAYWTVAALCVSVEWSLIAWGADFMAGAAGLTRIDAVTVMGLFFAAMVAGRIVGSRLTRLLPTRTLLVGALALCLAGFPVLWLARSAPLNVAGLVIVGLGVANLYPMTMSTAVESAALQSNAASARLSLAVGLATLIGPLALGWLADQATIERALGAAGALLVASLLVTLIANRMTTSTALAGT
jgi:predicted MFS family arabinose efflux permease